MALSDAELAERRAYIGGTDAAAIAGVNPRGWAQAIDVYREKVGEAEPRSSTRTMSTGHLMEPVVASLFTEATGIRLRRPAGPVRSRRYPWAGGHLDRWAADGAIFEAKWAMRRDEWGESLPLDGSDLFPTLIPGPRDDTYRPLVPPQYMVQVQHYLAVTERPLAYLAVLLGWGDFRWYAIWRDEAMIGTLMQLEEAFWRDHVLAKVPPEPDGSPGYQRYLRQHFPADDGEERTATPEQQALVDQLREADRRLAVATLEAEEAKQRLQASMGTTQRLVAPGASITWRRTAPRLVVHTDDIVERMIRPSYAEWPATKKAQAALIRDHLLMAGMAHEEPGTRRFTATYSDDDAEEQHDA